MQRYLELWLSKPASDLAADVEQACRPPEAIGVRMHTCCIMHVLDHAPSALTVLARALYGSVYAFISARDACALHDPS